MRMRLTKRQISVLIIYTYYTVLITYTVLIIQIRLKIDLAEKQILRHLRRIDQKYRNRELDSETNRQ